MSTMVILKDPKTGEDTPVFKDLLIESYTQLCQERKIEANLGWIENLQTFELDNLSDEIVEDEDEVMYKFLRTEEQEGDYNFEC